jgi:hypothetical protein
MAASPSCLHSPVEREELSRKSAGERREYHPGPVRLSFEDLEALYAILSEPSGAMESSQLPVAWLFANGNDNLEAGGLNQCSLATNSGCLSVRA